MTLDPGEARRLVTADWADTLVVVEQGEVELECCTGRRATFVAGAVLTFAGLSLRCLHNHGSTSAVLCAVARSHEPACPGPMTV